MYDASSLRARIHQSRNPVSKVGMTPLTVTSSHVLVKFLLPISYNFRLCWSTRFSPKGGIFPPRDTAMVPLNRVNVFFSTEFLDLSQCWHIACACVCVWVCVSYSVMSDSATPQTVASQAALSLKFSRQEYWNGLHSLLQGIFPTQGLNPVLPHGRQITI